MGHLLSALLKLPAALLGFIVISTLVVLGTPLLAVVILISGTWHG